MPETEPSRFDHSPALPTVSVVMPVYNALPHLDEAIESILGQTFRNFEFVILDDCSTDGSRERAADWAARDSRIRLLKSGENLGPVGSSNVVARAAGAGLVARMDADDVSEPSRLAEQVRVLQQYQGIGLVGTLCDLIDAAGRRLRGPETWRLARQSVSVPFAHGTIMYRRELFDRVGSYREACRYWEDQDLVVRMAAVAGVAVIPRALYRVRIWPTSTRVASNPHQIEQSMDRMYRAADRLRSGAEYDDILTDSVTESSRVDPRVFMAVGAVQLWGGGRPDMLRPLLKRGRLSFDGRTVLSVVWAVWALLSPSSLRALLRLILRARNRSESAHLHGEAPVLWQPGVPPREVVGDSRPPPLARRSEAE